MYTTAQDVRDLLGLSVGEAPDSVLDELIEKAQKVVVHYVQINVDEEEVHPDGMTIVLSHKYLADRDFDMQITSGDVKVYCYPSTNLEERYTLPVEKIWPELGVIKLLSVPLSFTKITVSYAYYTCAIDWNLLSLATAYYAGMLWVAREEFLVPEQLAIGNVRIRQEQPWDKLRNEFRRIIYHMTEIPMDIVNYKKIMISPRSGARYYGPGTVLEAEDLASDANIRDDEAR
jgi:hypothetical protein